MTLFNIIIETEQKGLASSCAENVICKLDIHSFFSVPQMIWQEQGIMQNN